MFTIIALTALVFSGALAFFGYQSFRDKKPTGLAGYCEAALVGVGSLATMITAIKVLVS